MLKKSLFKNGFVDFYKNSTFSDVTLITKVEQFKCHKLVLSIASDFFDALLKSDFKENLTSVIHLQVEDPRHVLPDIIQFMYTGDIPLTLDNVVPILHISDVYLMKSLKRVCLDYITKYLNRFTALKLLKDTIEFSQEDIESLCLKKLASNFLHMYDEEYVSLDKTTFSKLLHHPQLAVTDEYKLYKAICRYIKSTIETLSLEDISHMAEAVKFYLFKYEELQVVYMDDITPKHLLVDPLMERLNRYEGDGHTSTDSRFHPRHFCGIEFESDAREGYFQGIFHWLSHLKNPNEWQNLVLTHHIQVAASSVQRGEPHFILEQNPQELWTCDVPASWICIDLKEYRILPHAYVLRHGGNYKADSLRNWDFQGSNDGNTWSTLRRHHRDESLNAPFDVKLFKVENVKIPYRYLRILQTGHNSNSRNFLVLSGLELYGELWHQEALQEETRKDL